VSAAIYRPPSAESSASHHHEVVTVVRRGFMTRISLPVAPMSVVPVPPPPPELLSRYERERLAYEFDQLLIDYRNLRGRLDDSDRELSELYYSAPLSYQYNY